MISVALVGADGAGKTTVARRLESRLPMPVRYLYMGINPDASNVLLPTTRLLRNLRKSLGIAPEQGGPPDPERRSHRPRNPLRRFLFHLKAGLGLLNRLAEDWNRSRVARSYLRRGFVVLYDRHNLFDYYFHGIADGGRRSTLSRIHGLLLKRLVAEPDLIICLDAPAEVLFARKREGTVELSEARRQEYLQMAPRFSRFEIIDATQELDAVVAAVTDRILREWQDRAAPLR